MGVLMHTFYWDCPAQEKQEFQWWNHLASKMEELKKAGFTALWLPPAGKPANLCGPSMGYDVYDYYDLGEYDQKGSVKTWYGSKDELLNLIRVAHKHEFKVYADLVLNHNCGGDAEEDNPIIGQKRWTKFMPKSGLFTRDWTCFHPSPYETSGFVTFGDMPDLCHINPRVSTGILNHAKWMVEKIGFDGFRYDFVKGFTSWIVRAIHDRTYHRDGKQVDVFGVGECWDGDNTIDYWLDSVNSWAICRVGAFDFPLRYRLKDLCDSPDFNMGRLTDGGVLIKDRPLEAVTFVDNHDFRGSDEIINDKMLAYAYILTHEGYPCVYWKDYFTYGLAEVGQPSGIERLVEVHEKYAGGGTNLLYVDNSLYMMERAGFNNQPGLVFAMSNGSARQQWVQTRFVNKTLKPLAWRAKDAEINPQPITPNAEGWCAIDVPQRGYVVYG